MSEVYLNPLYSSSNLLSYWRLEGNSNDSKGSVNGSDTNMSYSTGYGVYGVGGSFNGSSSYISLGTPAALSLTTTVTISCWIYTKTLTGTRSIVHDATSGAAQGQYGVGLSGQKIRFFWGNGTTAATWETTNNVITVDNIWYHIVMMRDASKNIYCYVNSVNISGSFVSGNNSTAVYATPRGLSIGRYGAYSGDYWNGYIDDVAIFNRELNSSEIFSLYSSNSFTPKIIFF